MGPILIIIAVLLVIAKHDKRRNAANERCGANPIGRKLVMMVASSLVGNYASKYTLVYFKVIFLTRFLQGRIKIPIFAVRYLAL